MSDLGQLLEAARGKGETLAALNRSTGSESRLLIAISTVLEAANSILTWACEDFPALRALVESQVVKLLEVQINYSLVEQERRVQEEVRVLEQAEERLRGIAGALQGKVGDQPLFWAALQSPPRFLLL